MSMTFGERIKQLREEKEMSIAELAKASGIGQDVLEDIESDCFNNPFSALYKLAIALDEQPKDLLEWKE